MRKFKPSNPFIRREMAACARKQKTASIHLPMTDTAGYEVPDVTPQGWLIPHYLARREHDLVKYAGLIGQQRGLLPSDLSGWDGEADYEWDWQQRRYGADTAKVAFKLGDQLIVVEVCHLTQWPDAPVHEIVADELPRVA